MDRTIRLPDHGLSLIQFDIARAGWGADFNHPINFSYDLIHSLVFSMKR